MFIGLDYGTSQCAVTTTTGQGLIFVPLDAQQNYLTSCLYTPERCLITDYVARMMTENTPEFIQLRQIALKPVAQAKRNLSLRGQQPDTEGQEPLLFGAEALAQHMADPTEGHFIKSPKSFLGASGLREDMVAFFEDVVTAMMLEIKQRAEAFLKNTITGAVIGRPVNFQGINAEASNQQAQAILTTSAQRAGFKHIEFLYEPLAAGFDFERSLERNQKVLVVDIGGGTSDCSIVQMGPNHQHKFDRRNDFLAHTGERIGGNDFDIRLCLEALMPEYGLKSLLKNNLPMPVMPFVQAAAINDVAAQSAFYSEKMRLTLEQLQRDTTEHEKLQRFTRLREYKQNFALVHKAEQAKIALSQHQITSVNLTAYTPGLVVDIHQNQLIEASEFLLEKIKNLIKEAITQAATQPDLVYLTGGSAKSKLLKHTLSDFLGGSTPLVEGDHFGSVATGLGVWAAKLTHQTHD